MKCTSIKLLNRKDYQRKSSQPNHSSKIENPYYVTKGYPGYCCRFSPTKFIAREPQTIGLAIRNLTLSDNIKLNYGTSLSRWSKKTPRLTSSKRKRWNDKSEDVCEESDNTSFHLTSILDNVVLGDSENSEADYELTSDITEPEPSTNVVPSNVKTRPNGKRNNRIKNDLKKTIRFSFSKPASPLTEQVIRVDVTSNVSTDHFENDDSSIEREERETPERYAAANGRGIGQGEEDFIVKCRQLGLTQKKR